MKLLLGDSKEKLKEIEDNSVDFICTDPPYGYAFMGSSWDKSLPDKEIFKECFRVLKPGAFINVMSAPRTDVYWRMCQMIEEAGFKVDFTPIVWSYASGFPKSMNIGKAVDKKNGTKREVLGVSPAQRLNKPDNDIYKAGIRGKECFVTKDISLLEGSYAGFQPKPAVEMVIVAMKPLSEKTYVDQALKNGKGISWLDKCRIPYESEENIDENMREGNMQESVRNNPSRVFQSNIKSGSTHLEGRFPANLIVSDNSVDTGREHKGQQGATTGNEPSKFIPGKVYGDYSGHGKGYEPRGDSGDFSRYFSLDKWFETQFAIFPKASKSEKNEGCGGLEGEYKSYTKNRRCKLCGKQQVSGSPCKCENPIWEVIERETITKNHHPTVKSVKLMSYLITLFSQKGDIVLDPFMGSGTTGVACKKLERDFIGIELMPEYMEICKARINNYESEFIVEVETKNEMGKEPKKKVLKQDTFF